MRNNTDKTILTRGRGSFPSKQTFACSSFRAPDRSVLSPGGEVASVCIYYYIYKIDKKEAGRSGQKGCLMRKTMQTILTNTDKAKHVDLGNFDQPFVGIVSICQYLISRF